MSCVCSYCIHGIMQTEDTYSPGIDDKWYKKCDPSIDIDDIGECPKYINVDEYNEPD